MIVASFFRRKHISLISFTLTLSFWCTSSYIPASYARVKSITKLNSGQIDESVHLNTITKTEEAKRTNSENTPNKYELKRNTRRRNEDEKLFEYQTKAEEIVNGFKTNEFKPALFSTNPHFQTIAGVYVRSKPEYAYWNAKFWLNSITNSESKKSLQDDDIYWDRRQRIDTPDGDFYDVRNINIFINLSIFLILSNHMIKGRLEIF